VATGVRKSQKAATRERVLAAARELFDTFGYEETTVREIARRAGVSVGSVFTTFASKGDVLSQVMEDRLDGLYAELDRVVPLLRGSTADRLRSIFAILFAYEAPRTKLFLAHIAAAFDWTLDQTAKPYGRNVRMRNLLRETFAEGVVRGDVDQMADLEDAVDLVVASYAWTYRLAAWDGVNAHGMTAVMDRQIGLIARGVRPAVAG